MTEWVSDRVGGNDVRVSVDTVLTAEGLLSPNNSWAVSTYFPQIYSLEPNMNITLPNNNFRESNNNMQHSEDVLV